jgi:hypothetical protein
MGQYYKAVVIEESGDIKILSPRDFDSPFKLTGFSWCGNWFVNAVLSLIHNKKAKVAFIGDYSNDPYDGDRDFYATIMPKDSFMEYYQAAWNREDKYKLQQKDFSEADLDLLDMDTTGTFLVNHDYGEFLDIGAYIEDSKSLLNDEYWASNPLPLLTACGNGRGGGDFYSKWVGFYDVGIWAFATLEYTKLVPLTYEQVHFIFKE